MSTRNFSAISALYYLMGVTAGLLGSVMVNISQKTDASVASTGLLMSFFNVGALVGIALFNAVSRRFFVNRVISIGSTVMVASLLELTSVGSYSISLVAALLLGIGFGILDLGLVQLMTRTHETSIVRINISNAIFGLGGVSGALMIHFFDVQFLATIAWISLLIAIASAISLSDNKWVITHTSQKQTTLKPHGVLIPIFIAIALYVALEISAASWLPTISTLSGNGIKDGALATSLFYLFFTTGRFIGAPIARRVRAKKMIFGSLLLSIIPLVAALAQPDKTFWLVAITGLTLGPLYANTTGFLASVTPDNPGATTYLLYSAMAGSLLLFPLVGLILDRDSTELFPLALLALLLLSLTSYSIASINSKRASENV